MAYKDTLTLYEELVATGISDSQAKIMAHQHGELGDEVTNTCREIKEQINNLDKKLDVSLSEIKVDMRWIKGIGYIMILLFIANFFKIWLIH